MKALADRLGIRCVFTGELPDARAAYAAMDILVLPSAQPEPFGGVVMEAMALGLPVIGTDTGGTTEQVAQEETRFLVPPGDAAAIADAIARLAGDQAKRRQMGARGRKRVLENFDLHDMTGRLVSIYGSCARYKP